MIKLRDILNELEVNNPIDYEGAAIKFIEDNKVDIVGVYECTAYESFKIVDLPPILQSYFKRNEKLRFKDSEFTIVMYERGDEIVFDVFLRD